MPRKEFESFTRLDASDVNTFLMDQTVQSFAGTAARGSAIATPVEGMVTYLNDIDSLSVYNGTAFTTDRTIQVFAGTAARGSAIGTAVEGMYTHINDTDSLEYYNGSAWVAAGGGGAVLQVVGATKTDVFSTNSPTFTTVTGLTATITPSSASSKILVLVDAKIGTNNAASVGSHIRITGGNAATYIGDAASSRARTAFSVSPSQANWATGLGVQNAAITFLDSPATTSPITYAVEQRRGASSQLVFVNRTGADTDNDDYGRFASSITLMEVAG
jgi:hypothetical protein